MLIETGPLSMAKGQTQSCTSQSNFTASPKQMTWVCHVNSRCQTIIISKGEKRDQQTMGSPTCTSLPLWQEEDTVEQEALLQTRSWHCFCWFDSPFSNCATVTVKLSQPSCATPKNDMPYSRKPHVLSKPFQLIWHCTPYPITSVMH